MSKTSTQKSFIQYELPTEALEKAQGGRPQMTTLALGEEGGLTTFIVGEECGHTTMALGEEGGVRYW